MTGVEGGTTPEAPSEEAARAFLAAHYVAAPYSKSGIQAYPHSERVAYVKEWLAAAYAVDLPSLRREAAAQALEEAAVVAEQTYPRGGAHTYASENADRYIALEDACEDVANRLRARAQALREGR